jgi:dihydropteroate synthase
MQSDSGKTMELRRAPTLWKLRTRTLELGRRTLVMGVVNITPDSFSDGGRFLDPGAAVAHGLQLLDEGAHLLDLGAESTRPGVQVVASQAATASAEQAVTAKQEIARLLPVVQGILRERPDAILSVDTYKAETARAALAAGAEIVNAVSGFEWDRNLAGVCAETGCGVVLMHTRGRPQDWASQPRLEPDALLAEVSNGLKASLGHAIAAGVTTEAILLDPGYGFGKRGSENFALLARQHELLALGRPLLAGLSRKSFLGRALAPLYGGTPAPVDARETAGVAAAVAAVLHGASVVRVHSVRATAEAVLIADDLLAQMIGRAGDISA